MSSRGNGMSVDNIVIAHNVHHGSYKGWIEDPV